MKIRDIQLKSISKGIILSLLIASLFSCEEDAVSKIKEQELKTIIIGDFSSGQVHNDDPVIKFQNLNIGSTSDNVKGGTMNKQILDLNGDDITDLELEFHHLDYDEGYSKTFKLRARGKTGVMSEGDYPGMFASGEEISTEMATLSSEKDMYFISVGANGTEMENGNWKISSNPAYLGIVFYIDDVRHIGWIKLLLKSNALLVEDAAYW